MIIRNAKNSELNEVRDLWQKLFKDSDGFCDYYFKYKTMTNEIPIIKEEEQLVAMLHMNPYEIYINEKLEQVLYIVGVGTEPKHQKKGYMRALMKEALRSAYNRGHSLSILMPVDERIYTRFGYAFLQDHYEYQFHKDDFPVIANPLYECKMIDREQLIEVHNLYAKVIGSKFQMYINRKYDLLETILEELKSESGELVGFYDKGRLVGYLMYYNLPSLCDVREMIYLDQNVLIEMLSFIGKSSKSHQIQIKSHAIDIKRHLPYSTESKIILKPWMMGRIICLNKFLKLFISSKELTIILKVCDKNIQQNNNIFQWQLTPEGSQVCLSEKEPDIEMDIGTLFQWLMSYIDLSTLIELNKVKIDSKYNIRQLESIHKINGGFINEMV